MLILPFHEPYSADQLVHPFSLTALSRSSSEVHRVEIITLRKEKESEAQVKRAAGGHQLGGVESGKSPPPSWQPRALSETEAFIRIQCTFEAYL